MNGQPTGNQSLPCPALPSRATPSLAAPSPAKPCPAAWCFTHRKAVARLPLRSSPCLALPCRAAPGHAAPCHSQPGDDPVCRTSPSIKRTGWATCPVLERLRWKWPVRLMDATRLSGLGLFLSWHPCMPQRRTTRSASVSQCFANRSPPIPGAYLVRLPYPHPGCRAPFLTRY